MVKVKMKDIANIQIGYSNKLKNGTHELEFLSASSIRTGNIEKGKFNLRDETIEKLRIGENSIIISSVEGTRAFEYGKNHIGKIVGKGLYKIDIIDKNIPVEYIMFLLVAGALKLPYEGTIIKILKIKDLENAFTTIPSKHLMDTIVKLETYRKVLQKQEKDIAKYAKGIIKEIHGKDY